MAQKMITISHPDMEGTGTCTPDAFEKVWKDKGYQIVSGDLEEAPPAPEPVVEDEPEEPSYDEE